MLKKIKSIKQALDCKCYLPALALALTLPDICGQIEYPNLRVGKRYETWFDEWVGIFYNNNNGFLEDELDSTYPKFDGKICYRLRCCFLHAGNSDINDFGEKEDDEYKYQYSFELCINGCDSYGIVWSDDITDNDNKKIKEISIRLNVEDLCRNLCYSAKKYYDHKGSDFFEKHQIKIIDIESEFKKIRKLNYKY